MADADAIILCKGWSEARGCKVEFYAADVYGIPDFNMVGDEIKY